MTLMAGYQHEGAASCHCSQAVQSFVVYNHSVKQCFEDNFQGDHIQIYPIKIIVCGNFFKVIISFFLHLINGNSFSLRKVPDKILGSVMRQNVFL